MTRWLKGEKGGSEDRRSQKEPSLEILPHTLWMCYKARCPDFNTPFTLFTQGGTNVRSVMGLMGMAGGSLLGKLRLRLSTLVPGQLHTVDLPLQVWNFRCGPNPICIVDLIEHLPSGTGRASAEQGWDEGGVRDADGDARSATPGSGPGFVLQAPAVPGGTDPQHGLLGRYASCTLI